MRAEQFDDLTRALVNGMSRRQFLKMLVASLISGLSGAACLPEPAGDTCNDQVKKCILDAQAKKNTEVERCKRKERSDARVGCAAAAHSFYLASLDRCRKDIKVANEREKCCPNGQTVCYDGQRWVCCDSCKTCRQGACVPCDQQYCEKCVNGICQSTCSRCEGCINGKCVDATNPLRCEVCGLNTTTGELELMATCSANQICDNGVCRTCRANCEELGFDTNTGRPICLWKCKPDEQCLVYEPTSYGRGSDFVWLCCPPTCRQCDHVGRCTCSPAAGCPKP